MGKEQISRKVRSQRKKSLPERIFLREFSELANSRNGRQPSLRAPARQGPAGLRRVAAEDRADRSAPNLVLSTPDVLADEDERHRYFFSSGANTWCSKLELTFSTTLCALTRAEAQIIVSHWEDREREIARLVRDESDSAITLECGNYAHPNLDALLSAALVKLAPMQHRLQIAIQQETAKSPAGRAFVKLSTRSPKDSKKALLRAKIAYEERIQTIAATSAAATVTANERWKILSEEVTKAGVENSTGQWNFC